MRYDDLSYVDESQDPSIQLETEKLVARVIDNTGLEFRNNETRPGGIGRVVASHDQSIAHFLGYHGVRCLFDKEERRNICAFALLNWQGCTIDGLENDPSDERSMHGRPRGWPMSVTAVDGGARVWMEALPQLQLSYELFVKPAEPDGFDFSCRWTFGRKPEARPANFTASFACYMNAWDDVRLWYPQGAWPGSVAWVPLGEKPNVIIGDGVNYKHDQSGFSPTDIAAPVAIGRIGRKAFVMMFNDDRVVPFCVNSGGHQWYSAVQNPAWDFQWKCKDYPLNEPVGFDGRICYFDFEGEKDVERRYEAWRGG